jgi:hypothetical protein
MVLHNPLFSVATLHLCVENSVASWETQLFWWCLQFLVKIHVYTSTLLTMCRMLWLKTWHFITNCSQLLPCICVLRIVLLHGKPNCSYHVFSSWLRCMWTMDQNKKLHTSLLWVVMMSISCNFIVLTRFVKQWLTPFFWLFFQFLLKMHVKNCWKNGTSDPFVLSWQDGWVMQLHCSHHVCWPMVENMALNNQLFSVAMVDVSFNSILLTRLLINGWKHGTS